MRSTSGTRSSKEGTMSSTTGESHGEFHEQHDGYEVTRGAFLAMLIVQQCAQYLPEGTQGREPDRGAPGRHEVGPGREPLAWPRLAVAGSATFQQIEKECSAFLNKIAELEQEVNEHQLVLKAFEKVEPARRCFRMVGGVLVERTVSEAKPAVEGNMENIKKAVAQLEDQLKKKSKQRSEFVDGEVRPEPAGPPARRAGGGSREVWGRQRPGVRRGGGPRPALLGVLGRRARTAAVTRRRHQHERRHR
ncbi:unnamed protein product [Prorocentrum cordatum]|uniref:Prefoldin subunit 2 n=1 Tax=Prorocentrum cordatum TaxID=2364126 RepID=A0ABN9QHX3_9DINO|nr:unnamed protein product [Polarella glacialis]